MALQHSRTRIPGLVNEDIAYFPTYTVAYNNVTGSNAAGEHTMTWSHTVGSGTHRVLIVIVGYSQASSITSVTYNSVSLTKLDSAYSGNEARVDIWYLINPPSGSYNIVVTAESYNEYMEAGAVDFTGVNQTTPCASFTSNTPTPPDADVAVTLTTGDYMVAGIKYWNDGEGVLTPDGGQTEIASETSDTAWRGEFHMKNGSGSQNIGYTGLMDGENLSVIAGCKISAG